MKILSIETSGTICGIALSVNGKLALEINSFSGQEHDRLLATFIQRTLNDANIKVDDLDAVAVSAGPGSFTGVRIGGAMAKSMCFEGSPKLIAVPTLDALAYQSAKYAEKYDNICIGIKSHKDLIYFRKYDNKANPLMEIVFDTYDNIKKDIDYNSFLAGTGFETFGVRANFSNGVRAGLIAEYANSLYSQGKFVEPEEYVPMYVQEFQPK